MVRKKDKPHLWLLEDPASLLSTLFDQGDITKKEYRWATKKRKKLAKRYGEKTFLFKFGK